MFRLILIISFLLSTGLMAQWQGVFTLSPADTSVQLKQNANSSLTRVAPEGCSSVYKIGRPQDIRYRAFFQWTLADSLIPDSSVITAVRIKVSNIQRSPSGLTVSTGFFDMQTDIITTSKSVLWSRSSNWQNSDYYMSSAVNSGNSIDVTYTSSNGPQVLQAVKNSLTANFFSLGLVLSTENTQSHQFSFGNCNVELEIKFTRPAHYVSMDQKSSANASIDSVFKWEETYFSAHQAPSVKLPMPLWGYQVVRASGRLVNGEKHKRWSEQGDYHYISRQRIKESTSKVTAAFQSVAFDGSGLASGAYIYRLQVGNAFVQSRKLLLVK